MRSRMLPVFFCAAALVVVFASVASAADKEYPAGPPFGMGLLKQVETKPGEAPAFNPISPYEIFINYELGMHCVGFDVSYCCIIPPYNSIQAQAVRTGQAGGLPRLLSPDDDVKLRYGVRDNSYSEGNKMKYWSVPKDVDGDGKMDGPGDNIANYVWDHLYIYKDLKGTLPEDPKTAKKLRVGREILVNVDSGPSGKPVSGGYMDYAGGSGGNVVFTGSMLPGVTEVPLKLTASHLWDALGLPLTAFNDSRRKGSIRTITEAEFQPYQYATVGLMDAKGNPVTIGGRPVEFFGTEPVDISNCVTCHSGKGRAAVLSREQGMGRFDKEYAYWKKNYPDCSEYIARLSTAAINILELHDKLNGTGFLKEYNPDAPSNRLGSVGPVNCADCHGQNISGNLVSPRPNSTGYKAVKAEPMSEAVHGLHAKTIPMPDKAGRTQSCQACHPTHWQEGKMNDPATNPYQITDEEGYPRFTDKDLRTSGGGCYLRRDAHTNPDATPPFFLNEIGRWFLENVSLMDEAGKKTDKVRGLYCTNCHNFLSQDLYKYDNLTDAVRQEGRTMRNKSIKLIVKEGKEKFYKEYMADPVVGAAGDPLLGYYAGHEEATMLRIEKTEDGRTQTLPWNSDKGEAVPYGSATAGSDWWLSASLPHCADCHIAPFVESMGGGYFPIDQPNKYSLYRYSKAHGPIACQSCHESTHGLYPVRYEGTGKTVDLTTREQALQFSPDGKYAGPVTCAACHTVGEKGVPVQLKDTAYYADYWASVVLLHYMREGDEALPVAELVKKYPYEKSREVVVRGW